MAAIDRLGARESKSEVYLLRAALILPWSVPIRDTYPLLHEAFHAGLECGDIQQAAHTGSNRCTSPFAAGEPLVTHAEEVRRMLGFFERHKHDMLRLYNGILAQAVFNLLGEAPDPLVLEGEGFDEAVQLPVILEAKSYSSVAMFHFLKAMLAYLFGDHARARTHLVEGEPFNPALAGLPMTMQVNLLRSLAELAGYPAAGAEEREKIRAIVETNQAQLGKWAEHAAVNVAHKRDLVAAELARCEGRVTDAMALYQQAIRGAAEQRFLHEEAIANERCADFCREQGWIRAADAHLIDAYYAYQRWGAAAKLAELEARYPALQAESAPLSAVSASVTSSGSGGTWRHDPSSRRRRPSPASSCSTSSSARCSRSWWRTRGRSAASSS